MMPTRFGPICIFTWAYTDSISILLLETKTKSLSFPQKKDKSRCFTTWNTDRYSKKKEGEDYSQFVGDDKRNCCCCLDEGGGRAEEKKDRDNMATPETPRKTRTVRLSQSQIDLFLSYDPKPVARDPDISEDPLLAEAYDMIDQCEKEFLEDKEMIQKQYEEKGYVEYQVFDDDDDGETRARPPPRRRRSRPGVVKRGGEIKRLN